MIELMIVIAVMGLVLTLVMQFLGYSKKNLIDFENKSELIRYTERISENIRASIKSSNMLLMNYDNNTATITLNYETLLNNSIAASASGTPGKIIFSKIPLAITNDRMTATVSSAKPYFGNDLQFAANISDLSIYFDSSDGNTAYANPDLAPSGNTLQKVGVRRVQFVNIYVGNLSNSTLGGMSAKKLALVEWRSQPIIVLSSINWMDTLKKEAVIDQLTDLGYTLAWQAGQIDANQAFYKLRQSGSYLEPLTAVPQNLPERSWAFMHQFVRIQDYHPAPGTLAQVSYAATGSGVSGFSSGYSVAYNTGGSPAGLSVNKLFAHGEEVQVPRFANAAATGFPGGFEVFISGSLGRRKVYAYLTMMAVSAARKGPLSFNASHSLTLASVSNPL